MKSLTAVIIFILALTFFFNSDLYAKDGAVLKGLGMAFMITGVVAEALIGPVLILAGSVYWLINTSPVVNPLSTGFIIIYIGSSVAGFGEILWPFGVLLRRLGSNIEDSSSSSVRGVNNYCSLLYGGAKGTELAGNHYRLFF